MTPSPIMTTRQRCQFFRIMGDWKPFYAHQTNHGGRKAIVLAPYETRYDFPRNPPILCQHCLATDDTMPPKIYRSIASFTTTCMKERSICRTEWEEDKCDNSPYGLKQNPVPFMVSLETEGSTTSCLVLPPTDVRVVCAACTYMKGAIKEISLSSFSGQCCGKKSRCIYPWKGFDTDADEAGWSVAKKLTIKFGDNNQSGEETSMENDKQSMDDDTTVDVGGKTEYSDSDNDSDQKKKPPAKPKMIEIVPKQTEKQSSEKVKTSKNEEKSMDDESKLKVAAPINPKKQPAKRKNPKPAKTTAKKPKGTVKNQKKHEYDLPQTIEQPPVRKNSQRKNSQRIAEKLLNQTMPSTVTTNDPLLTSDI